jgi:hypothetical protein
MLLFGKNIIEDKIMWYKFAQETNVDETEAIFDNSQSNEANAKFNPNKIVNDFFLKYKNKILNTPLPAQNSKSIIDWARKNWKNSILFSIDSYDQSGFEDIRKIRKFEPANNFQQINSDMLSSYPKLFNELVPLTQKVVEKLKSDKDIINYFQKINSMLLAVQENEESLPVDSKLIKKVWENENLSMIEKYQFLQKHFGNTDIWKKYLNDFKNILPKGLGR